MELSPGALKGLKELVPEHLSRGLQLWIEHGVEPGGFLVAVICNDLRGACERADPISRHALFEIVSFLHTYAPRGCWGNEKAYSAWKRAHEEYFDQEQLSDEEHA